MLEVVAGAVLGAVASLLYFGGLWWTLQRLSTSSRPHTVLMGSFIGRAVVLVAGAMLLGMWSPVALLASLPGFWLARGWSLARYGKRSA